MPAGDPMWTCPHCGKTYYAANQLYCSCRGPGATWAPQPLQEKFTSWGTPPEAVMNINTDTKIILHDVPSMEVAHDPKETLVVNLFAGPGAGKSTTAAGIFFELKSRGINCEIASEYAKDLAWEERHQTFNDQIYIFGKQYHRIFRLLGQVQAVITDSPLLLSPVYDAEKRPTFEKLVVEEHNKMWTYNVFIKRQKAFNPKGRVHGEEEAKQLDYAIADMLLKHDVAFEGFEGTVAGRDAIVQKILMLLKWKKEQ